MTKKILFFTASHDPHSEKLEYELRKKGCEVIRFDVDKMPNTIWCDQKINNERIEISIPESLQNVDSVFYRRLAMVRSQKLWQHIPEKIREFSVWEIESALFGICGFLDDKPWINHFKTIDIASNKPYQLMVAQKIGLTVPDTLVTNSPSELTEFYKKHKGSIIYKPVSYNVLHGNDFETGFVYTSRVTKKHLESAEKIKVVPGIFQEEIKRQTELRITVVDHHFFVVQVKVGDPNQVDWRRDSGKGILFKKHEISDHTKKQIMAFMKHIGLRYGAFDFIVKPDGTEVFLEVNPQGAYMWLEEELGLNVTSTIAKVLCGEEGQ